MAPDLIYLIEQASLGVYGETLFKSANAELPTGDGPITSILETGGTFAEGTHNSPDAPAYERPSCQIVVRAADYDVALDHARALQTLFYPIRNMVVNGTWWRSLSINQPPFELPADDQRRPRLAFNLDAVKRVSPATSS